MPKAPCPVGLRRWCFTVHARARKHGAIRIGTLQSSSRAGSPFGRRQRCLISDPTSFSIMAGTSILWRFRLSEKPKTASSCAPSVGTVSLFDDRGSSTPDKGPTTRSCRQDVRSDEGCGRCRPSRVLRHVSRRHGRSFVPRRTIPQNARSAGYRFGLVVKGLSATAHDRGRALRQAYELRLLADYDAGAKGLAHRAVASLAAAALFITFAQSLNKRR